MSGLRLPRMMSDGMVLQQKKKVRIYGFDCPKREVMVSFLGEEYVALTDEKGEWEVWLKELQPGGPHTMQISDDRGEELAITDILVGDVWICAGQSNMELPMERVKDRYPEEIQKCDAPFIRTFKVAEHADFHGPLREHLSGEWKAAGKDTVLQFSAAAYFFAKHYHSFTGVPVGLVNTSLGGSKIESWMSREMLAGCGEELETADKYADEAFIKERLLQNQRQCERWHGRLDAEDLGLKEHWEQEMQDLTGWKPVTVPFFFRDTQLKDFIGSVWLRRQISVPQKLAGKACRLWLGTIVDSDTVFVNGVEVGHTDYQYPPRKYRVPEGLLREGENTIVIRVKCENGHGRVTPDKKYALWNEEAELLLSGEWYYRIGAECPPIEPTDFVNWKPTGLYHGMLAPCRKYTIAGFLWYQGEGNTHVPGVYLDRMERLIKGLRKEWQDEELPFLYVQLPNYAIDIYDSDTDETGQGWPVVRELQRQALAVKKTKMAVTIDIGEDNDLHPLNKEEVGRRLALLAAEDLYGRQSSCQGPSVIKSSAEATKQGCRVVLECKDTGRGMYADGKEKGDELLDFELQDKEGSWHPARAALFGQRIVLECDKMKEKACKVRYCFANTNKGGLVYNEEGFPMSPFVAEL